MKNTTFSASTISLIALLLLGVPGSRAEEPIPTSTSSNPLRRFGLLELRQPVKHEIAVGQTDSFTVKLKAGQFMHVVAEQKGVDLVLSVADPSGKILLTADTPNGKFGPEPGSIIAPVEGQYQIEVSVPSPSASPGEYSIELTDLRALQQGDALRIEAESLLYDVAKRLAGDNQTRLKCKDSLTKLTAEFHQLGDGYEEGLTLNLLGVLADEVDNIQQAQDYYQQALAIRHQIGDRAGEAQTLKNIGRILYNSRQKDKALAYYERALPLLQEVGDQQGEAGTLNALANLYSSLGEKTKALAALQRALPIRRELHDQAGEAVALINLGQIFVDLNEPTKGLEQFQQALTIERTLGNHGQEATVLSNMAGAYSALGDKQKALQFLQQALPISQQLGDRSGTAVVLNNIGMIFSDLGEQRKALEYFQQSLPMLRELGDRAGEAQLLNNMGGVCVYLGQKHQAVEYLQQALSISRSIGDRSGEAQSLVNLGQLSGDLGEKQKALDYYTEALPIFRALSSRSGEATVLNNIGLIYASLGEYRTALNKFQEILPIFHAIGDPRLQALILNNIGQSYQFLGNQQKALEFFQQALPLESAAGDLRSQMATVNNIAGIQLVLGRKQDALQSFQQVLDLVPITGDRRAQEMVLNAMAFLYAGSGDNDKALPLLQQALPISQAVGDREGEARILFSLSQYWQRQDNFAAAIFFGKQAVNVLQGLRRDIQGLDKNVQQSYLGTITGAYRNLADLLLAEGRLPEAEDILSMLKDQELKEFTRGEMVSSSNRNAALTITEKAAQSILSQGLEWQELSQVPTRTPQQQVRYEELDKALTTNNKKVSDFWQALQSAIPPSQAHDKKIESSATQKLLRLLPRATLVVYTLVLDDKLDLVLISPDAMVEKSVSVKRTEVAETVEQLRSAIRDRRRGEALLAPARRLYDWLVMPIATELEGANAQTIAWSLDGVLRYIPVNVLYDGQHYLIERYTNVIFTPADMTGLEEKPIVTTWKALGLGVSKQYRADLNPLPAVPGELRTIVRDQHDRESHGPLPGRILLDDEFTEQALEQELQQHFPLVHIASHFVVGGTTDDSYLLLGGEKAGDAEGYQLRLSDLENKNGLTLDHTALLSLSACETAMGKGGADGKEVDSLAAIGRQRGAQAVLASLWDVNDESTGQMMADFYQRWIEAKGISKAEALRASQLDLLRGNNGGSHDSDVTGRGFGLKSADRTDTTITYSHPYYWAPFILMGNWQ